MNPSLPTSTGTLIITDTHSQFVTRTNYYYLFVSVIRALEGQQSGLTNTHKILILRLWFRLRAKRSKDEVFHERSLDVSKRSLFNIMLSATNLMILSLL
jgi:hypothetical protein